MMWMNLFLVAIPITNFPNFVSRLVASCLSYCSSIYLYAKMSTVNKLFFVAEPSSKLLFTRKMQKFHFFMPHNAEKTIAKTIFASTTSTEYETIGSEESNKKSKRYRSKNIRNNNFYFKNYLKAGNLQPYTYN